MRIVFDNIIFSLQRAGGISAFWARLLGVFLNRSDLDCYFIEYEGAGNNIFRRELNIPENRIIRKRCRVTSLHRLLSPSVPNFLSGDKFIFHSSYYRICKDKNAVNVATFHDFAHEFGFDGRLITRFAFARVKRKVIMHSRAIACVSDSTANDLRLLYPECSGRGIVTIHHAAVNDCSAPSAAKSPLPYLLFVGARDDYKNFKYTCLLAEATGYPLCIAGAPLTDSETDFLMVHEKLHWRVVTHPGAEEMASCYNGALCLMYVSAYEGFGIPLLEAQLNSCPVAILKGVAATREVAGDSAFVLNALSVSAGKELIAHLEDSAIRANAIARGLENQALYSWECAAEQYIALYRSVVSR